MQEIKFRAWNMDQMVWVYFTFVELLAGKAYGQRLTNWGQYTGVKDNSEEPIEVYEGDILQRGNEKPERIYLKQCMWYLSEAKDDQEKDSFVVPSDIFMKRVVGNIYQNSDLLK